MAKFAFDWTGFTEKDLMDLNNEDKKYLPEDMIYGYCYVETEKGNVIIDIHFENPSYKDRGFDLEIYESDDDWYHRTWIGSCHKIRSAHNYKRFCRRVENLFIKNFYDVVGTQDADPVYI